MFFLSQCNTEINLADQRFALPPPVNRISTLQLDFEVYMCMNIV